MFDVTLNEESLAVNLDLVIELCDKSKIWETVCKLRASRRYNTKVRPRSFQKGDLFWREVLVQLGTFSSSRIRKGGSLSLRMAFEQIFTKDVECHAP